MIRIAPVLIAGLILAGDFKVPGPEERIAAIGNTQGLPKMLRKALAPGEDFAPIPSPESSDWLAVHKEEGQTFEEFQATRKNVPDRTRNKIYLQPLGAFPDESGPSLETLREFASVFFALEVVVLKEVPIDNDAFTTRVNNYTKKRQLLTGDILTYLHGRLPRDAFCLLGVTLEDLYPDPSWNFVFGQASLTGRTGVYSFVRYDPAFYGQEMAKEEAAALRQRRSLKVLAHETAHMFAITHCVHFACLMNGSNHLDEADSRPLHLCPVCLRKLQSSVGFDVVERYQTLRDFYRKVEIQDEADWLERRLKTIRGGP
jgi:archaemetzincin